MTVTTQTNCTLEQLAAAMRPLDDFVICGHVSPDGDCLGSQLGLAAALRQLGKHVTCVLVKDEPIEANLAQLLPGAADMVPACEFDGPVGAFVGVDVPTRERIGQAACRILDRAQTSFTIDHHAVDERMCDMAYVDPDAASTTLLIWELADLLGVSRSGDLVTCCYTGLVTDTGRFQYQNTDAHCMRLASQMVEQGADPAAISRAVFHEREGFAISYLTLADFARFGAVKSDAEPVINALRSIAGVNVACMLRQHEDCIRGSLRAKDDTDVSAIARSFGGGGHVAAAGFTLHTSMQEAIEQVRAALQEAVCAR